MYPLVPKLNLGTHLLLKFYFLPTAREADQFQVQSDPQAHNYGRMNIASVRENPQARVVPDCYEYTLSSA